MPRVVNGSELIIQLAEMPVLALSELSRKERDENFSHLSNRIVRNEQDPTKLVEDGDGERLTWKTSYFN